MPIVSARFETDAASRHLVQLCKHFAHKVAATWNETAGEIDFAPGTCTLSAGDGALSFTCHAETEADVERLIHVVEIHLVRFAWRETVALDWTDENGMPVEKSERLETTLAEERAKFAAKRAG